MNATPPPFALPAAEPYALDANAIARLRELDPDGSHGTLPRLFATFESSLVRLMARAADARDRNDAAAAGEIAHQLKSSSASLGALSLSACCADIERRVKDGDVADIVPRLEQLLAEGARALGGVRAMLRAC